MPADDGNGRRLRSRRWFDDPADPAMTALYLERYMNYGITPDELRGGKPIIGIAQTGSDLSPCNRHHIELASRVRDGIRAAGGVPLEFPIHPIQETGKRPTAALDRNLAYLSPGGSAARLSDRRRGADHRLRQDHAGLPDGRGDGEHSGHRAVRRTDAGRLVARAACPAPARSSGKAASSSPRARSATTSSWRWCRRPRRRSATATRWAPRRR